MRCIQLAEHLAQHITKVKIVVDIRQEAFVSLAIAVPIDAV